MDRYFTKHLVFIKSIARQFVFFMLCFCVLGSQFQVLYAQSTNNQFNNDFRNNYFPYFSEVECEGSGGAPGSGVVQGAVATNNIREFIDQYGQLAFNTGKRYGIPYEAIIAQAAVESGYGKSKLTQQANNFFGIKAGNKWTGPVVYFNTGEEDANGNRYTENAPFRAYATPEEGFNGYGEFITQNSRYSNALNFPNDPYQYIQEIRAAGYATDLEYVQTVSSVIGAAISYIREGNLFPPSSEVTPDVLPPNPNASPTSINASQLGESNCAPSGSSTNTGIAAGNPTGNRALGLQAVTERGWSNDEWVCLEKLWTKESGWKENAINDAERNNDTNKNKVLDNGEQISETEDDAYGIPQSKPGGKMKSAGEDWRTNPTTQIKWGLDYIQGRYNTPCGAWSHSQARNWY